MQVTKVLRKFHKETQAGMLKRKYLRNWQNYMFNRKLFVFSEHTFVCLFYIL